MINTIIIGFLIAWFFTEFPLFKWMIDMIPSFKYSESLKSALKCHKCMSFYITFVYGLIFLSQFCFIEAIAASFLAATYNRIINSLPININF